MTQIINNKTSFNGNYFICIAKNRYKGLTVVNFCLLTEKLSYFILIYNKLKLKENKCMPGAKNNM